MKTILILDTETTGLGRFAVPPQEDRIVEIGLVLWSVEHSCIISTWSDLVVGPDNAAEAINHIPAKSLGRGTTLESAMMTLVDYAQRADLVIAHRAEFDHAFVGDLDRGDLSDPRIIPWCCSKFDITWPLSKPGDGLAYVAIAHGVPVVATHRALTDCLLLARCFERCAELGHSVPDMLAKALRPRALFEVADKSFDTARNALARENGFSWNAPMKRWERKMAREDVAALPFKVREVMT